MKTMLLSMLSLTILAVCAWLFKVDITLMLLLSVAYDLTYLRIERTKEEK